MSLLDQAAKNTTPYKLMMQETASKNVEQQFIVQPNLLVDILNDEMEKRVIDKKMKKQFAGFRTRLKTAEWRLAGMLNFVDEKIYREQINKTIQSMLKHIKLVQPNGDWILMEYEAAIRPNMGGEQAVMLAANFVDAKNEEDMRYQNGVPMVDVKVDVSNSNKELIEAIKAQGENTSDSEMKQLMKEFIKAVAQNVGPQTASQPEEKEEAVLKEAPTDFSE